MNIIIVENLTKVYRGGFKGLAQMTLLKAGAKIDRQIHLRNDRSSLSGQPGLRSGRVRPQLRRARVMTLQRQMRRGKSRKMTVSAAVSRVSMVLP